MTEIIIRSIVSIILGIGGLGLIINALLFYVSLYRSQQAPSKEQYRSNLFRLISGIVISAGNVSFNVSRILEIYLNSRG